MVATSISHHLRNPGMIRFPCKYQKHNGFHHSHFPFPFGCTARTEAWFVRWCRISSIQSRESRRCPHFPRASESALPEAMSRVSRLGFPTRACPQKLGPPTLKKIHVRSMFKSLARPSADFGSKRRPHPPPLRFCLARLGKAQPSFDQDANHGCEMQNKPADPG